MPRKASDLRFGICYEIVIICFIIILCYNFIVGLSRSQLLGVNLLYLFLGVITFSPMNYQKMRDAPMDYQRIYSTKIEHSTTKDNHFLPFCQLEGLKETVNGLCAVLHGLGACWKMMVVHGGEKRKMVVVHGGKRGRK
jgi:hypothetical protein